jgi:hypothetical protein
VATASLKASAQLQPAEVSPTPNSQGSDIYLTRHAVAAKSLKGQVKSEAVLAAGDQSLEIRVMVHANDLSPDQQHLLVDDGYPDAGGEIIAAKVRQGVDHINGTHVGASRVPRTSGHHQLWGRILEKVGDAQPGNHLDILHVWVVESSPAQR